MSKTKDTKKKRAISAGTIEGVIELYKREFGADAPGAIGWKSAFLETVVVQIRQL
jgi:hypothetical protein